MNRSRGKYSSPPANVYLSTTRIQPNPEVKVATRNAVRRCSRSARKSAQSRWTTIRNSTVAITRSTCRQPAGPRPNSRPIPAMPHQRRLKNSGRLGSGVSVLGIRYAALSPRIQAKYWVWSGTLTRMPMN
jgi:hypothetical protein